MDDGYAKAAANSPSLYTNNYLSMDDGYAKAAAGESVSFTVSDITDGYEVDAVSVSYGEAGTVDVIEANGVNTFIQCPKLRQLSMFPSKRLQPRLFGTAR